jgi:hypothetical protein
LRLERVLQVQDLFAEGEVLGEDARAVGFEGADADRLLRIDPVILSAMHFKLSLAVGGRTLPARDSGAGSGASQHRACRPTAEERPAAR